MDSPTTASVNHNLSSPNGLAYNGIHHPQPSVLQNPQAMEKSLLVYFGEVATVQSSLYEGGDVGQKLKLSFQQVYWLSIHTVNAFHSANPAFVGYCLVPQHDTKL